MKSPAVPNTSLCRHARQRHVHMGWTHEANGQQAKGEAGGSAKPRGLRQDPCHTALPHTYLGVVAVLRVGEDLGHELGQRQGPAAELRGGEVRVVGTGWRCGEGDELLRRAAQLPCLPHMLSRISRILAAGCCWDQKAGSSNRVGRRRLPSSRATKQGMLTPCLQQPATHRSRAWRQFVVHC